MTRKQIMVALVVVALCFGAFAVVERGRAEVGERIASMDVTGDGVDYVAPVPFGQLSVQVTSGDEATMGDDAIRAPRGGAIVEVRWALRNGTNNVGVSPVWPGASAAQRREPPIDLDLVVAGRSYPIVRGTSASADGGMAVIAVDGDAENARVRVNSAGRSVLAEPAPEDASTRPAQSVSERCNRDMPGKVDGVTCDLTAVRVAYVAGLGWAPTGHEWILVRGAQAGLQPEGVFWMDQANGDNANYQAFGQPNVTLTSPTARLVHRAGSPQATAFGVALEQRAYAVRTGQPAELTLRFRQQGKLKEPAPGQPAQRIADRSLTLTLE